MIGGGSILANRDAANRPKISPKQPTIFRRAANHFSTLGSRLGGRKWPFASYYKIITCGNGFRAFSTPFFVAATTTKSYNFNSNFLRTDCLFRAAHTHF